MAQVQVSDLTEILELKNVDFFHIKDGNDNIDKKFAFSNFLLPASNPTKQTVDSLGDAAFQDIVPVSMGGTGADNQATARNNLGLTSAATTDIGTGEGDLAILGLNGFFSVNRIPNLDASKITSGILDNTVLPTDIVRTSRTLTGGTGINTIGDLSSDRTISVDSSVAIYGVSGGQVRTNAQNDSRFAQLAQVNTFLENQNITAGNDLGSTVRRLSIGKSASRCAALEAVSNSTASGSATSLYLMTNGAGQDPEPALLLSSAQNATFYGNINRVSDAKFKDKLTPFDVTQDQLDSLELVNFEWLSGNRKGQKDSGVIAQQVQEVFPTCVTEVEEKDRQGNIKGIYLTVDYGKLAVHISLAQRKLDKLKGG